MISGLGTDIVEIGRIKEVLEKHPKFLHRVLTPNERKYSNNLPHNRKVEFVAGRFAAKEAYAKALGTGIGQKLSFQDIEIISNPSGKPIIQVKDRSENIFVSISHSKEYAVANVIIESLSS